MNIALILPLLLLTHYSEAKPFILSIGDFLKIKEEISAWFFDSFEDDDVEDDDDEDEIEEWAEIHINKKDDKQVILLGPCKGKGCIQINASVNNAEATTSKEITTNGPVTTKSPSLDNNGNGSSEERTTTPKTEVTPAINEVDSPPTKDEGEVSP